MKKGGLVKAKLYSLSTSPLQVNDQLYLRRQLYFRSAPLVPIIQDGVGSRVNMEILVDRKKLMLRSYSNHGPSVVQPVA